MKTLSAVLEESFALLAEGAADPHSPWRHPALATVAPDGRPGVRTLVLRRFDPAARCVDLHTDGRSPKMATLAANPRAALHGWDCGRRIQLRLDGVIAVADAAATARAWDALHAGSRATYAAALAPGTPIADPGAVPAPRDERAARADFRVLALRFDALEYLSLARQDHRRARFDWKGEDCQATWLVP
jgi:pyridoxine/pyridoxamine 5'-phosphate oxidase